MRFVDIQLHHHQQMRATVISLTYGLENEKHTEVQEQEFDVHYICEILVQYSITARKEVNSHWEKWTEEYNRFYRIGDNCGRTTRECEMKMQT